MPATITPFAPRPARRTRHPFGDESEQVVQAVAADLRRIDAEQLQIIQIMVRAILRGAL